MTKQMITTAMIMLATLFLIGTASAATVDINSKATENAAGEWILPIGIDAFTSVKLEAVFHGWSPPANYTIQVREGDENPSGTIVWSTGPTLVSPGTFKVPITWVPTKKGDYTVYAQGNAQGTIRIASQVTDPVPELSTGILMSAGLIGLVGLTRYRRKE